MHKTRVYELAKKLNMSSKELINQLHDLGIDVKSHMSTLSDEQVEDILSVFEGEKEVKEEKKPEEKKEKEVIKGEEEEEKKIEKEKEKKKEEKTQEEIKEITISAEDLTLDKLAQALGKKQNEIIKDMFMKRIMLKPYQKLDKKTAEEIALNYNVILEVKEEKVKEEEEKKELQDPEEILKKKWEEIYEQRKDDLKERPPVVTVMGHVDHGKTTLLDRIRNTRVAEREVGGITQSIGAYQIIYNNKKITFIDTPGHEAFTEMRARGAQATDIVVLVVAADDGVMPQTIEAYNHAKNAGVPIIVAINKIDKPNANVEMTKQELVSKLNIVPEDWGGDTITVPISAKLGKGIDDLLEMILLVAEMEEIKAIPDGKARGVIIESKLNKAMGPVATVIVKDGILKVGDYVVAGSTYGKVRRMVNPDGKDVKKAYPSDPVQIIGFEEVPDMHSMLYVVDNLEQARTYAERKKELEESKKKVGKRHMRLEDIMRMMQETKKKVLNLIIKADTFGASEALKNAIFKLKNPDIDIQIIHAGIGVVTTSDVMLASASDAIILGFRVKIDRKALQLAEREGVQIKRYDVIFNLIDDLKKALEGMLEPEEKEEIIGYGEIKEVFKIRKVGNVAGVQLTDGFVTKDSKVRLFRNGKLIYDGSIESLKHYKDDVNKVEAPKECGIKLQNYEDINRGDELEFYRIVKVKKELKFES